MTIFARRRSLPVIPASFFAMTLGLAETGNAWRFGTQHWGLPSVVGELLQLLAIVSFVWWITLYAHKWLNHRALALKEMRDPVQSAFIALIPESLILVALALLPYQGGLALTIFWVGSITNLLYGTWRLATSWSVQREPDQTAPPLLLTYTASILVNALAAGLFGYIAYGWMLFGIGAISWLILDSVLTQQLMSGGLAVRTRNFMGIYMAPSVVALVAYQELSGDTASTPVTLALCGYALFVVAGLLTALRWLRTAAALAVRQECGWSSASGLVLHRRNTESSSTHSGDGRTTLTGFVSYPKKPARRRLGGRFYGFREAH